MDDMFGDAFGSSTPASKEQPLWCWSFKLVRSTTDTNRLQKYLDFEMSPILLPASAPAVPPPVATDPAAAFLAAEQVILPFCQPYISFIRWLPSLPQNRWNDRTILCGKVKVGDEGWNIKTLFRRVLVPTLALISVSLQLLPLKMDLTALLTSL